MSLGISYWLNGVLIGRVLLTLLILLGASMYSAGSGRNLRIHCAIAFLGLCAAFLVPIWSYVGIWRSADHHVERGGSGGWAVVARIMVVFGVLSTLGSLATTVPVGVEIAQLALNKDRLGIATITASQDGRSLYLSGQIGEGSAERFRTVLAATPDATVLQLNSVGGRVGEALDIADALHQRHFNTDVTGLCVSACTLIFLAGAERAATPNAKIGFHSTSFAGRDQWSGRANAAYQKAGLSDSFLMRGRTTPSTTMWYPTRDELLSNRIVSRTSLGGESTIGLKERGIDSEEAFAKQLRTQPMWGAIDARFPGSSDRASQAAWAVKADGGTDAAARTASQAVLHGLFIQALKTTDDETLNAYAVLNLKEMNAARSISAQACTMEIEGKLDVSAVLPKAVVDEAFQVAQRIISSKRDQSRPVSQAEYSRLLAGLFAQLPADQHAYFNAPATYAGQSDLICRARVGLFTLITAMPAGNRSTVLRGMWQKPG